MIFWLAVILKLIVYSFWCYKALTIFPTNSSMENKREVAVVYGLIRIALGFIIGFTIAYLFIIVLQLGNSTRLGMNPFTALFMLILIHSTNWLVILRLMTGKFLFNRAARSWLAGGTGISCLMDIVLFACFQMSPYGFC